MTLTEEEAKTKWCPYVHQRVFVLLESDRDTEERTRERIGETSCIASGCMAWAWVDPEYRDEVTRETVKEGFPSGCGGVSTITHDKSDSPDRSIIETVRTDRIVNRTRRGFCRLLDRQTSEAP